MDLLLIAFLTILNGLFAMSEMALASSRKALLTAQAEEGVAGAQAALDLQLRPTEFLSTIQIGITTLGVLNGIIGEAAFSHDVALWFVQMGAADVLASVLATTLVVTLITLNTILFGELVPKRIGQIYPETAARLTAPSVAISLERRVISACKAPDRLPFSRCGSSSVSLALTSNNCCEYCSSVRRASCSLSLASLMRSRIGSRPCSIINRSCSV